MADLERINQGKSTAHALITKMQGEITKAMPRHLSGEAFARNALTVLRQNSTLLEAITYPDGQASFLGALMSAAQLGLELGPLGHCYLIPYARRKRGEIVGYEVTFIIGYKGMVELARRSGNIKSIYANEVCANDVFEMGFGVNGTLNHRPELRGERGEVYGFYAYADLGEGAYQFVFLRKDEVDRIMKDYAHGYKEEYSPWQTEYNEMAKKTAIRRLFKTLPISVEVAHVIEHESKPLAYDAITGTVAPQTLDVTEPVAARLAPPEPKTAKPEPVPDSAPPNGEYRVFDTPQKIEGSHCRRSVGAMAKHFAIFTQEDLRRLRLILLHMCKEDVEAFAEELKATDSEPLSDGRISGREELLEAFISKYYNLLPEGAQGGDDE